MNNKIYVIFNSYLLMIQFIMYRNYPEHYDKLTILYIGKIVSRTTLVFSILIFSLFHIILNLYSSTKKMRI